MPLATDVNARDMSPLPCTADARVWSALARIGRTEDLHFSPNNQRLAVVGHLKNQLLVLDVDVPPLAQGGTIRLIDCLEVRSDALVYPHGVFWTDDQTLIVANRQGEAPVLHIPRVAPPTRSLHVEPCACSAPGRWVPRTPPARWPSLPWAMAGSRCCCATTTHTRCPSTC